MRRPVRNALQEYRPTQRDRAALALYKAIGDGPVQQKFARGLFGSSGLGHEGIGVADFTPLGALWAGDEAGRQIARGQPMAGVANLLMAAVPVPAAAKGAAGLFGGTMNALQRQAAKAAPKAVGNALQQGAKAAKPRITAYHGSPHSFDKFSMDKIGTGEGAQAYGHGLYFAESEDAAKSYRDGLSDLSPLVDGEKKEWSPVLAQIIRQKETPDGFIQKMQPNLQAAQRDLASASDDFERMVAGERLREVQNLIKEADSYKGKSVSLGSSGHMYQVGIDADPYDFLDFDAPLASQPAYEKLKTAEGLFGRLPWGDRGVAYPSPNTTGYEALGELFDTKGRAAVSDELKKAGIPGIKYLDAGSRGAGDGSRNYVVFDDKLITILKKYGWVPGMAIPAAAAAEYARSTSAPPQKGGL